MSADILQQIKALQFSDKLAAEKLVIDFIRSTFSLNVSEVELRPLPVSLNSFNGFLTLADGKRLFFKTHTEPDNVIGEYYNATTLAEAGYPVIKPLYSSTDAGKQLLIYKVIEAPSVFDVAWDIENSRSDKLVGLTEAQHAADAQLLQLYLNSLEWQSAKDAVTAPIHQLFYHRLVGGRLERFYGALPDKREPDIEIQLPSGTYSMKSIRQAHWVINGSTYSDSLDDIIARSMKLLSPAQAGPSVIGHGDAHNGNVFFQQQTETPTLLYFDPAFAGRHHPLLDLTKPLFHNVFAMWMYFPHEKHENLRITLSLKDNVLYVEHDYALHPVREIFFRSKVERVLLPILRELKRRDWLRVDWREYFKSSLFCCPFLTMNLADSDKFPPEISLLGLAMSVEMGADSQGVRSLIDKALDELERDL
jgi:hypothetical protein